jgi:hypothetical protein
LYSNMKNPPVDDSFLAIEAVNTLIESNEIFCQVRAPSISPLWIIADS